MTRNFQLAILNRLKQGRTVAAELPSSSDKYRRWIAIFKSRKSALEEENPKYEYSIFDFGLEKYKIDEFKGDEGLIMIIERRHYVNSFEELVEKLISLKVDPAVFTYPGKCDFPMGN
jgi:hypothetical protein